ncbi:hypothetical protein JXA88_14585 [Candidatus Fermentibacteria bacterium]|nr:hypothetical protein [Candidatus Fermentibacteria bacterium]
MTKKLMLIAVMVGFVMPATAATPKPKPKKKTPPSIQLDLVTGLSFTYDDNVFRYSEDEIDLIKNLPQTDQYSTVETTDDLIIAQSLGLQAYKGDTRVTLTVKQNSNYRNTMKSFHNYSLDLRRRIGSYFYTYLTYRYTPRYYIRQIYDEDTMDYEEYDYAKHFLSLQATKGLLKGGRLGLRARGQYEREKYPDYFQEYDFHGFAVTAEAKYGVTRRLTLGVSANYRRVTMKGYDEPGETKETSDETDGSYHENNYDVFGSYILPVKVLASSPSLSFGLSYNLKACTTKKDFIDDPYHAGRKDNKVALETGIGFSLGAGVSANLNYKWQKREVDSYAKDDLGEEKDFTANTIGLSMSVTRGLVGKTGR